jgi:hypothetical protein
MMFGIIVGVLHHRWGVASQLRCDGIAVRVWCCSHWDVSSLLGYTVGIWSVGSGIITCKNSDVMNESEHSRIERDYLTIRMLQMIVIL